MRILFEDTFYDIGEISRILPVRLLTTNVDETLAKTTYVGYFYSSHEDENESASGSIEDAVFILPKVFISENGSPFGKSGLHISDYMYLDSLHDKLDESEINIISSLSFWLYLAISRYKEMNEDTSIICSSTIQDIKSIGEYNSTTAIDVIQSLRRFNREHQSLFTFIVNNSRSGINKINWAKTISRIQPLLQDGSPVYLDFCNKKKSINFDEEIIVLFYSVLNYLSEKFHFDEPLNFNFNLIPSYQIEEIIENEQGTILLNKIRHKYFTDELVQLWQLLYAFFDKAEKIASRKYVEEEVLAKSFNNIFEDMVDQLIGSTDSYIQGLRNNKDGKIIDHLYEDESLINNGSVYFIADSKYYKEASDLGENSVYKQFTYARNIIQYNLNLSQKSGGSKRFKHSMRDELTEGYNIVPNFFIRGSAMEGDKMYDFEELKLESRFDEDYAEKDKEGGRANRLVNYHFPNRLFDRDTQVLQTYSINFLYVLAKYVEGGDEVVKAKIHKKFRDDLITRFNALYSFYRIEPVSMSLEAAVEKYFRKLTGKVIRPFDDCSYLILALEKGCITEDSKSKQSKENADLLSEIRVDFKVEDYELK